MKFLYSDHFLVQVKKRRISKKLAKTICLKSTAVYSDAISGHEVAVKRIKHAGRMKDFMVSYDIIGEEITLITSYPLRKGEVEAKVKKGRWVKKDEKN